MFTLLGLGNLVWRACALFLPKETAPAVDTALEPNDVDGCLPVIPYEVAWFVFDSEVHCRMPLYRPISRGVSNNGSKLRIPTKMTARSDDRDRSSHRFLTGGVFVT